MAADESGATMKTWHTCVIESPYAGDVDANMAYLRECTQWCLARGLTPYASHKMLTDALDDNDPAERALGISAGLAWAPRADWRVFFVDRGWSRGMGAARVHYERECLSYVTASTGLTGALRLVEWVDGQRHERALPAVWTPSASSE